MKIYSNGKDRTLTGSFPARFKLLNNGVEVPFIRTGKGSVRLSGDIPFGELDVEEVIKQKTPQPAKLDAQSIAIINKSDFDQIDLLNKKLAINQEQMNAQLSALTEHEATLANLETQNAQSIEQTNESMTEMAKVFGKEIQADRERIKATAKSIAQDIAVSSEVLSAKIEAHEKAKNPHKITKETIGLDKVENTSDLDKPVSKATQKALDKKADKSDIEDVRKEIKATEKKQERLVKSIDNANLYGGIGGNELPIGGKTGQILGKKSDKTGDYGWFDNSAKPKWGDIGGNINNQTDLKNALDAKQNVIDDLEEIRAGATAGSTAVQPDDMSTAISDHNTSQQAHTYIQGLITSETTNRENADIGLQNQIDAITASSDVKDIVGTYAQLQAYDTSTLGNNDIIKVLQDETHSDETTYYRWSTTTETFTLIGEEGPYYTKSEANSTFVPQTRTVNGKALSSDISLTYSDVGAQQAGNYVTTNTVQTITEAKTFTKAVHFTGTGDTNAVFLTENTRFDIEGTTRTILGMGSAQFYINHSSYALLLRGKNARPSYNSATSYLALLSDLDGYVPTTRTVNGKALSSDISLTASDVGALPDSTVIPTVNDATLTIQKNGTDVATFTANSSTNQTANISVPTDTSDLTNGAGFITGITSGDVTTALGYTPYDASNPNGYTSNVGTVTSVNNTSPDGNGNVSLSIPTVNDSTITIQKNGTTVDSFTTNASSNKSINITVPTSAADVSALPSSTKYGADLSYSSNTLQLKDQDGNNLGSPVTISGGGGSLPSQTGHSGEFLTTDGTDASWASVSQVPSQSGQSGKFLTTDGTSSSWAVPKTHNLFDFIWRDSELNDQSWLRADTFSWQDGTVYSEAYNHLVADYNGGTIQSETVGGYTVWYMLADDGHKICGPDQETAISNIYNSTGVAWYYVLDTTNQRFKLPRTKFGFTGLRDAVGKYVLAGLPNITGNLYKLFTNGQSGDGVFSASAVGKGNTSASQWEQQTTYNFDASRSSSIYGNSTTVQPPATQMYLYFYVGQFSQTATEQTAGLNSELFNGKVDLDGNNATFPHIVETYENGTDWYRLWSNGWVEQGGRTSGFNSTSPTSYSVTFLKAFADTNYNITTLSLQRYNSSSPSSLYISTRTTTGFSGKAIGSNPDGMDWEAKGMSTQS